MNINFLKLGILYNGNVIVNHRSISKVLLNPILRKFGYQIVSIFEEGVFIKYKFIKCAKARKIQFTLKTNPYTKILIKNIF